MSCPASEKLAIIRTVEASRMSLKQTLAMIGVPGGTYYDWYSRWVESGMDALADRSPRPVSPSGTASQIVSVKTLSSSRWTTKN